jgi:hypothetical protein
MKITIAYRTENEAAYRRPLTVLYKNKRDPLAVFDLFLKGETG